MSNYIITGANSEIGYELTNYLSKQGHNLLLVSRSEKDNKLSLKHPWIDNINLANEKDLIKLNSKINETFSSKFTLIHSVGDFWKHKSITNTSFDEAISQINSHYITLYGVIKYTVPIMKKVGGGSIVAFSCNSVRYNYPDMAAFTSSKAAVECLIKCIANEQAKNNIVANAFALPSIKTNSVIATKPEEYIQNYMTIDELVETIESICENISPQMNGNIISLFKYSKSFYNKGYYERNIIWSEDYNE